ncbi:MAG: putative acyl esterase, partial [Flavobacteriales bacterium]
FLLISTAQPESETIAIPMSDGEFLAADVYLPDAEGTYPIILIQTPL